MAGGSQLSNTDTASQGLPQTLHLHRGLVRRKSHAPPDKYDEENDPIPDEQEEGPVPVTIRHVFEGLFHSSHHDQATHSDQVDVEHYIHDKSFRRRLLLLLLSNSSIGIRLQSFRTLVLVIGCVLYVAEATYYDYSGEKFDVSNYNTTLERELNKFLYFVIYPDKPVILWILQVCIGFFGLFGLGLQLYARVTECSCRAIMRELNYALIIQLIIGLMYAFTLLYPAVLRSLFVPLFLLCWPAQQALSAAVIQSASRQIGTKTFTLKAIGLAVFLVCFTFTWVCLLHRVELVNSQLNLFDTIWFVLVTLSSVGYGDIHPDHYTGKLLVMLFIIVGFIVILPQLEELYHAFQMQQKLHNSVNSTDSRKHIVLCSTELKPMVLRDFLAEIFSDPKHLDVHCVVLVEKELSPYIQVYLSHPVWSSRITVLIGSPMRRADLARARIDTATACFIHTSRSGQDPETADQHTVISAWSVKNTAPDCKLYVHFLRPETRMHLDLADQVLCEGEIKLALMANHVHCPGISTLVTLLLHTFKSEFHDLSGTDYRLYDMCSSCEVYDTRVGDSKYFHYFIGKNYLYASVVAYRRYQVTLLGVRPKNTRHTLLNPGLHYILNEDDICFYIGFTREEYSKVREATPSPVRTAIWQTCANLALLSMSVAGINTDQLGDDEGGGGGGGEEGRGGGGGGERGEGGGGEEVKWDSGEVREDGESVRVGDRRGSILSQQSVRFHIAGSDEGPGMDRVPSTGELPNAESSHNVVKRGLKLLRFHSRLDIHANPVVKVNVSTPVTCSISPSPLLEEKEGDGAVTFDAPPTRDNVCLIEEGRGLTPPTQEIHVVTTLPMNRGGRSLRHSLSDDNLSEIAAEPNTDLTDHGSIIYSSQLSLVNDPGSKGSETQLPPEQAGGGHSRFFPLTEVFRRMSSWNNRQPSIGNVDFKGSQEVVLDLEDVAEERELEDLEDGRCGGDEEEEGSEDEHIAPPTAPTRPRPATCSSHRYVKGSLPRLPYCGCDPVRLHLLPERRPHRILHIDHENLDEPDSSPAPDENVGVSHRWQRGGVIVYSEEATEELYHLLLPLRAHYLHTAELRHILLLLGKDPSPSFLDLVSPLPMVHYMTGDIVSLDTWLRAGVLVCECVIITGGRRALHEQEHMVDATHILVAQKVSKLFPHVNIMTELHYRHNMRFLQPDNYVMYGGGQRGDHLSYLFQPQFAAGRTFCASMLDTLLYQSHVKPYIVDLIRQLLGCQQVNDSAYLWKLEVVDELLKLQTYDRLFQRVATVHHCVPLGLYRTTPLSSCPIFQLFLQKYYSERVASGGDRYMEYLRSRLTMMEGGELDSDLVTLLERRQSVAPAQSFVLVNPPHKTQLQQGDILLTLRPHHPHLSAPPHSLPCDSPPCHPHPSPPPHSLPCDSPPCHPHPSAPPHSLPCDSPPNTSDHSLSPISSSPHNAVVMVTAECH